MDRALDERDEQKRGVDSLIGQAATVDPPATGEGAAAAGPPQTSDMPHETPKPVIFEGLPPQRASSPVEVDARGLPLRRVSDISHPDSDVANQMQVALYYCNCTMRT